MRYFTKTINDKDYNFRITSADISEIEKKNNVNIQEFITNVSFDRAVTLLRYMRKSSEGQFSLLQAQNFMDELVDDGYSLETVYTEIIFPACVDSGILTEADRNKLMEAITEQHNKQGGQTT